MPLKPIDKLRWRGLAENIVSAIRTVAAKQEQLHEDLVSLLELLNPSRHENIAVNASERVVTDEREPATPHAHIVSLTELTQAEQGRRQAEQRQTRTFQWWTITIQGLLLLATAGAFVAAAIYAHIASLQKGTMERQLEATDRPWIQVRIGQATKPEAISAGGASPDLPLAFDQNGQGVVVFSLTLTNVGKSVANRIDRSHFGALATGGDSLKEPSDEQTRLCSATSGPIHSDALFPNDPSSANTFGTFQTKDIPASSSKLKTVHLFIIGCVNYDYPSAATIHQTRFIYEVFLGEAHAEIHRLITVPMTAPPIHQLSFELREMYAR
jgi:hypothetical protein